MSALTAYYAAPGRCAHHLTLPLFEVVAAGVRSEAASLGGLTRALTACLGASRKIEG